MTIDIKQAHKVITDAGLTIKNGMVKASEVSAATQAILGSSNDMTEAEIDQWVEQEFEKHTTMDSVKGRISSETMMVDWIEEKGVEYPNSYQAHKKLLEKLTDLLKKMPSASNAGSSVPAGTRISAKVTLDPDLEDAISSWTGGRNPKLLLAWIKKNPDAYKKLPRGKDKKYLSRVLSLSQAQLKKLAEGSLPKLPRPMESWSDGESDLLDMEEVSFPPNKFIVIVGKAVPMADRILDLDAINRSTVNPVKGSEGEVICKPQTLTRRDILEVSPPGYHGWDNGEGPMMLKFKPEMLTKRYRAITNDYD